MNKKNNYDWIIIGGGISGISIAEILTRDNNRVLLIEKNLKLASETSKVFHEWLHTGSLYTLKKNQNDILRFSLGAIDDLIEFYGDYEGMNIKPTESGLKIIDSGWFNDHKLLYKYKVRKLNIFWLLSVTRSFFLITTINNQDWLRRRAGDISNNFKITISNLLKIFKVFFLGKNKDISVLSSDISMNSRVLISDLLNSAINNGLDIQTNTIVQEINNTDNINVVSTNNGNFNSTKVVVCSPDLANKFNKDRIIKKTFSPMCIFTNKENLIQNFVELDYYPNNCTNLIRKNNNLALVSSISFQTEKDALNHINFIKDQMYKINPNFKFIDSYIGVKKELVTGTQNRNYQYHINYEKNNIWSIVLGKFSMAFSMAPEFYRQVYKKNPKKKLNIKKNLYHSNLIDKTMWEEIYTGGKK